MLGYLWVIALIIFMAVRDKSKRTFFFLLSFLMPYFIFVEIFPANFEGIQRLIILILIFSLNLVGIIVKKQMS